MARPVAVRNLPHAIRQLTGMNCQGEGWESVRDAGRGAVRKILEASREKVSEAVSEEQIDALGPALRQGSSC
jgi:hypothetical protein